MSGLREYLNVECGTCFGEEWERVFGPKRRRRSGVRREGSEEKGAREWAARSTTALNTEAGSSRVSLGEDPFRDPVRDEEDEWEEEDAGARDGTEYMTRTERKAWRIIEAMKKEDEWGGTRYQLLGKYVASPCSATRAKELTSARAETVIRSPTSCCGV